MEMDHLQAVIEGLLFITGEEGIAAKEIAVILELDKETVAELIEELKLQFKQQKRGLQIIEVAGNYQLTTLPEHAHYFEKLASSPSQTTLSQAALETLAIIAYRQPISRVEIEEIRGVKSDKAITTLINKLLIKEVGRMEGTGRAIIYGTTKEFLDYFGLRQIDDLPPLEKEPSLEDIYDEAPLFFQK